MSLSIRFSVVECIERDGNKYALKVAEASERETTIEQIEYLEGLPENLKPYFPEIIESEICDDRVSYLMPFYDMISLDKALCADEMPVEELERVLRDLITVMFKKVYPLHHRETPKDYILNKHIERIEKRIAILQEKRPDLAPLLEASELIINGIRMKNALPILKCLRNSPLINKLTPPYIGFIHGDLEANHIMFQTNEGRIELRLIDPRTNQAGGDLAYDIGKLFQSLRGYSHEIQAGSFTICLNLQSDSPIVDFKIMPKREAWEYQQLIRVVESTIDSLAETFHCPNWQLRTSFVKAAHFLSAPPFFLGDEYPDGLAEALYIQGVLLINEFYNEYMMVGE